MAKDYLKTVIKWAIAIFLIVAAFEFSMNGFSDFPYLEKLFDPRDPLATDGGDISKGKNTRCNRGLYSSVASSIYVTVATASYVDCE